MNAEADYIIVGSGINSLVCAAQLALAGHSILILEREQVAGGCMRTEEITIPGFRHDLFSMSLPLFVTAPHFATLGPLLAAQGMQLLTAPAPTAVVLPDGRSLVLSQSRADNIAAFDRLHPGDGAAYARAMAAIERDSEYIFGLLGQPPRSRATLSLLAKGLFRRKVSGMAEFGSDTLAPMRGWLEREFGSDLVRALIAPWILHTGLGPDDALSAVMGKLILFTLEAVGITFVEGGIARLVESFERVIAERGGEIRTGCDVERILVEKGTAIGVAGADGRTLRARRGVICNVTPTQLYGRLLSEAQVSADIAARAERFRYGRACMQIHLALSEPPRWADEALAGVALIHLTPGLDGVSRAVNEAERGLLPVEGTVVVGQPAETDPSRCPPGRSSLWIQLQELPRIVKGDAAGTIEPPADGRWTAELRDAYARRVVDRLGRHVPNLRGATIGMAALSPADLEARNINLVGGDPYSGACSVDQFHLFRPMAGGSNHGTPIKRLHHIGASTHPGPGLGGGSGHMLAMQLR